MIKFLKESIKEFEHVTWPTNKEVKNYFKVVISLIVILSVLLFLLSSFYSKSLFFSKDIINPAKIPQVTDNTDNSTWSTQLQDLKLDNIETTAAPKK